jgi:hypothetical protein
MQTINITNSTVFITNSDDGVSAAKDRLLEKMYYARHKDTIGGYDGWLKLLEMYYAGDYKGMRRFIQSCRGYGGKTRNECVSYLNIIIKGEN